MQNAVCVLNRCNLQYTTRVPLGYSTPQHRWHFAQAQGLLAAESALFIAPRPNVAKSVPREPGVWSLQAYLVSVRGFCSNLTSTRLQQLTEGQVQRLPDFLASQQVKHELSAQELESFGDKVIKAVTAACHAALEQLETQLAQV